jgi:hypothetical protein
LLYSNAFITGIFLKDTSFFISTPQFLSPPHLTHTAHTPFHLSYHPYKQCVAPIAATAQVKCCFVFAAAIAECFQGTINRIRIFEILISVIKKHIHPQTCPYNKI